MTAERIQQTLLERYYKNKEFSEQTSSHWRKFGNRTKVVQTSSGLDFNSYGISAFGRKKVPILSALKHVPIDILLARLLKKYNGNQNTIRIAKSINQKLNINFDFDHAKHVLAYDLLYSYGFFKDKNLICIIGDGHGYFGTLIKKLNPKIKIILINLGRNLLIDHICFSKVFPELKTVLLEKSSKADSFLRSDIIFLEAEYCELMKNMPINLFINVASMQEMDLSVINRYFDLMRTSLVEAYFTVLTGRKKHCQMEA